MVASYIVGIIFLLIVLKLTFFTVDQQTISMVERFGRFVRHARPGLNVKIPFLESVAGTMSLRIQQLEVPVETKTEDNVFVKVVVAVQFHVIEEKIYEAFYKLTRADVQINSFVFDVVRASVPKMKLDDVFVRKDDIATDIKTELSKLMGDFGYGIIKALVTDIDPDAKVKSAMNEINEAQRKRIAATERGEAEKILRVKEAEAEAQSKALQGKGTADQRKAIIEGLRESVEQFQTAVAGTSAQDVMNLVLVTQYFDTLKEIGASSKTNTLLMPHSASGSLEDIYAQLRNTVITGNLASQDMAAKSE